MPHGTTKMKIIWQHEIFYLDCLNMYSVVSIFFILNQLMQDIFFKGWARNRKYWQSFLHLFNHSFKKIFNTNCAGQWIAKPGTIASGNLCNRHQSNNYINECMTTLCEINVTRESNWLGRHSWGCVYLKLKWWRENILVEQAN